METEWKATYRLDEEDYFCTATHIYCLSTAILSEAAEKIEKEIDGHGTLISLERVDV